MEFRENANDKTAIIIHIVLNVAIFLASFMISYILVSLIGWDPRSKLPQDKREFSFPELFVVLLIFTTLSVFICFRCGLVKDGIVSGIILMLIVKGGLELKLRMSNSNKSSK